MVMSETEEIDPALYDEFFCGVLSSEGDITTFLNAVFGFLYRRTDFFTVQQDPKGLIGFLPGVAEQMLLSSFRKWQLKALILKAFKETPEEPEPVKNSQTEIPSGREFGVSVSDSTKSTETQNDIRASSENSSGAYRSKGTEEITRNSFSHCVTEKHPHSVSSDSSFCMPPSDLRLSQRFDEGGETYNGAYYGGYWWTQSMTDIDVCVCVPPYIKKGTEINVTVGPQDFTVKVKANSGMDLWNTIIDDKLSNLCNKEDTIWSLDTNRHIIQLHLEKSRDKWWDQLLKSEPKINMHEIEATRPFSELSEEEQMTVSNLMHKERLKQEAKERGDLPALEIELSEMLPEHYISLVEQFKKLPEVHNDAYEATIRVNVNTKKEALEWLKLYSAKTNTSWRCSNTFEENTMKIVFKKKYRCYRNTMPSSHKSKHARPVHTNCQAKLTITVKEKCLKRSKDIYLQTHPCIIKIVHVHNHPLEVIFQNPQEDVCEFFKQMYSEGCTPKTALEKYTQYLKKKLGNTFSQIESNRAILPDRFWCYRLYYKLFPNKQKRSYKRKNATSEIVSSNKIDFQEEIT